MQKHTVTLTELEGIAGEVEENEWEQGYTTEIRKQWNINVPVRQKGIQQGSESQNHRNDFQDEQYPFVQCIISLPFHKAKIQK